MNDNEQNFSNAPYKATRNLNTMIGNPDINVGSVTTSNIMENNVSSQQSGNYQNAYINNFQNSVNNLGSATNDLNNYQNSTPKNEAEIQNNFNSNINNSTSNVSLEVEPVKSFINDVNEPSYNVPDNIVSSNENLNSINADSATFINSNNVSDSYTNSTNNLNSNVQYDNVYQTNKKKNTKENVSIPNEFKTAIFVVLILLVVLSCFEPVYDFFRNLDIFG